MAWLKRTHPDDAEFMSEVSAATLESAPRTGHSLLILTVLFLQGYVLKTLKVSISQICFTYAHF